MAETALLDVNVLVALTWPQHVHHEPARRWLAGWAGTWATSPVTEAGLLRLSLNRTVTGTEIGPVTALDLLHRIRQEPEHRFVPDDASLADPVIDLSRFSTGSQVTDLHLVNLCAAHDMRLATLDNRLPAFLAPADRRWIEVLPP